MQKNLKASPCGLIVATLKGRTLRRCTFLFLLGLSVIPPGPVHAGGQFYIINDPSFSTATMDLSADGSVAVGVTNGVAWQWSLKGGYQALTPPSSHTFHAAVSADGSTVVSSLLNPESTYGEAARWTSATGWQFLGGLPEGQALDSELSSGWGVSGDGSTVVGLAWLPNGKAEAFQWTDADGMTGLIGGLPTYSSRASKISADGTTIVGFYGTASFDRRPTRWTNGGDPDLFLGDVLGEATATTSDGSVIVGGAIAPGAVTREGFIYSDATGWTGLGFVDPTDFAQSFANAVSDTGVVVGWSGDPVLYDPPVTGFVWTSDGGMVSADDYMAAHGVKVPSPYSISSVTCISADGMVFGGQAADTMGFLNIAWVAVVQP